MGISITTVQPLLSEHIKAAENSLFDCRGITPTMASFRAKAERDGAGRGIGVPITTLNQAVASADFTIAKAKSENANGGQATNDRWFFDSALIRDIHCFATFTRKALNSTDGKQGEILRVVRKATNDAMMDLRNQLCQYSVGSGFAPVGVITAVTTTTITIAQSFLNRVVIDMDIVAAAVETTGVLRDTGTARRITTNAGTGLLGVTGDPVAAGWAVGDTIFREGCREDAASPTPQVPIGLAGWIGTTAVGGKTTVQRAADVMLSGWTFDGSGGDFERSLLALSRLLWAQAGSKGVEGIECMCSPEDLEGLVYQLAARGRTNPSEKSVALGSFNIGYPGISLSAIGSGQNVIVMPDALLPPGTAYMGPFSSRDHSPRLFYPGDLLNIDNHDGRDFDRQDAAAGYQMRLYSTPVMVIPSPGLYGKITGIPLVT